MSGSSRPPLSGFVLTGGRSSRFGSNKAFAEFKGVTLLDRALDALRSLNCDPFLVSRQVAPFRGTGVRVVDNEGPQRGPVAGWKAGLEAAAEDWVLALSVDMPNVSAPVLRSLIPASLPSEPQAFCFTGTRSPWHPFPGLYHRSLAVQAERLGSDPSMGTLLDLFPVTTRIPPGDPGRILLNINRPADVR